MVMCSAYTLGFTSDAGVYTYLVGPSCRHTLDTIAHLFSIYHLFIVLPTLHLWLVAIHSMTVIVGLSGIKLYFKNCNTGDTPDTYTQEKHPLTTLSVSLLYGRWYTTQILAWSVVVYVDSFPVMDRKCQEKLAIGNHCAHLVSLPSKGTSQ